MSSTKRTNLFSSRIVVCWKSMDSCGWIPNNMPSRFCTARGISFSSIVVVVSRSKIIPFSPTIIRITAKRKNIIVFLPMMLKEREKALCVLLGWLQLCIAVAAIENPYYRRIAHPTPPLLLLFSWCRHHHYHHDDDSWCSLSPIIVVIIASIRIDMSLYICVASATVAAILYR